jgi:hypothetical protein
MLLSCSLLLSIVDRYGDDFENLSVTTYVETTLQICKIIFTTFASRSLVVRECLGGSSVAIFCELPWFATYSIVR